MPANHQVVNIQETHLLMLTPLNAVECNTVLNQFPQGTELPQERNPLFHSLEHIVNLTLRSKPPNAEADTAVGALVTVSESS